MTKSLLVVAALTLLSPLAPIPGLAADHSALFPRPAELEPDITFWRRIYTEVGTDGGFIHDSRQLGVVYEVVRFPKGTSSRAEDKIVEGSKRDFRAALRSLASGKRSNLSHRESRVLALWGEDVSNTTLRRAASHLRFQLGQADKFRAGLIRAGAWRDYIHQTFKDMGLPEELAALPHVESSFTPHAYSRVGAAGLWQFTRSTGRRYMRVDHVIDERLDPVTATVAAARLLEHNRKVTGSWPLALTAYNHGASGMRRASRKLGTNDIAAIVRRYKSRTFGFASRNFYVSFLAALEIDSNPKKYFGRLALDTPPDYEIVRLDFYASAAGVAKALGVKLESLKQNNPALRSAVWAGDKRIPAGFELRVPRAQLAEPLATLLATVPDADRFAEQTRDSYHIVRRGESLSKIATRYRVSMSELASLNGLRSRHRIRTGQKLRLPQAATKTPKAASTQAAAKRDPSPPPADGIYAVRRGDALEEIASRFGVSERSLMEWNGIRNRHRIKEGQLLRVVEEGEAPPVVPPQHPQALAELTPPPSASGEFGLNSPTVRSDDLAESNPVAEVEEQDSDLQADPNDYSVAADGTVEVQAAETLGHYAEWLDVRASRLRAINHMRYGTPLAIGDRLQLDFARVSPKTFEARRGEHHRTLQGDFFSRYEITGTRTHVVRRGDSIWLLAETRYDVPLWLVRQYNPDLDLGELQTGAKLAIPELRPR